MRKKRNMVSSYLQGHLSWPRTEIKLADTMSVLVTVLAHDVSLADLIECNVIQLSVPSNGCVSFCSSRLFIYLILGLMHSLRVFVV